jgi:hypothetical protein
MRKVMDINLKRTKSKIQLYERSDDYWLINVDNGDHDASVVTFSNSREQALLFSLAISGIEVEIIGKKYSYNNFAPENLPEIA